MRSHHHRSAVATAVVGIVAALTLAACGDPESEPDVEVDANDTAAESSEELAFDPTTVKIDYIYTDSSIPPEYHRSFSLTIEDGVGTVVVDVYGDEVDRAEADIDVAAIEELIRAYSDGELAHAFDPEEYLEGCTGGTRHQLSFDDGTTSDATDFIRCQTNDDAVAELETATSAVLEPFDIGTLTEGRYTLP